MFKIDYACVCDVGRLRRINQDNFICNGIYRKTEADTRSYPLTGSALSECSLLFGVFDGMGGEEHGEIASLIASETAAGFDPGDKPAEALIGYCLEANNRICTYTVNHSLSSMGTTAAMLLFTGDKITLCNIGDSRIFRLTERGMKQISIDHVSIAPFGKKPPLSQSLGIPPEEMKIEPYIAVGNCKAGDKYLICSDGLTDMVSEQEIERILAENEVGSAAEKLLASALENGGKDNVSAIVLQISNNESPTERKCFLSKLNLFRRNTK